MRFNKIFEINKVSESIGNINFREAVRGIIIKDNKILMVHSKNKDYKFPGGGIKKGEGYVEALIREVEEETGYICSKITEQVGIVTEKSKDRYFSDKIFKMISYYYLAEVSNKRKLQKLDPYEAKLEFKPEWVSIDDAINNNAKIIEMGIESTSNWIFRETYVLKEIKKFTESGQL